VSPLLFTNSVINAASGYFSIARRNREPATVISMGPESFAGGLLCAASEAHATGQPVLLVAYDAVLAAPMNELLPSSEPCAVAWIISAGASTDQPPLATFELQCDPSDQAPTAPPRWLPEQASAQSSAAALAALGLLDAETDACRWPLGGVMLTLRRVGESHS
jgi:hypothetical protein